MLSTHRFFNSVLLWRWLFEGENKERSNSRWTFKEQNTSFVFVPDRTSLRGDSFAVTKGRFLSSVFLWRSLLAFTKKVLHRSLRSRLCPPGGLGLEVTHFGNGLSSAVTGFHFPCFKLLFLCWPFNDGSRVVFTFLFFRGRRVSLSNSEPAGSFQDCSLLTVPCPRLQISIIALLNFEFPFLCFALLSSLSHLLRLPASPVSTAWLTSLPFWSTGSPLHHRPQPQPHKLGTSHWLSWARDKPVFSRGRRAPTLRLGADPLHPSHLVLDVPSLCPLFTLAQDYLLHAVCSDSCSGRVRPLSPLHASCVQVCYSALVSKLSTFIRRSESVVCAHGKKSVRYEKNLISSQFSLLVQSAAVG